MTIAEKIVTLIVIALATVLTRFLPFMIFPEGKKAPAFVTYLGQVLPAAASGLLLIYALRKAPQSPGGGLAEFISLILVTLLYKWKKNTLLSLAGGTVLYMYLVQNVFI